MSLHFFVWALFLCLTLCTLWYIIMLNRQKGGENMSKLIATKQPLASGKRIINGYMVKLQKTKMEMCGFKQGDQLDISYKKGEVRIKKK